MFWRNGKFYNHKPSRPYPECGEQDEFGIWLSASNDFPPGIDDEFLKVPESRLAAHRRIEDVSSPLLRDILKEAHLPLTEIFRYYADMGRENGNPAPLAGVPINVLDLAVTEMETYGLHEMLQVVRGHDNLFDKPFILHALSRFCIATVETFDEGSDIPVMSSLTALRRNIVQIWQNIAVEYRRRMALISNREHADDADRHFTVEGIAAPATAQNHIGEELESTESYGIDRSIYEAYVNFGDESTQAQVWNYFVAIIRRLYEPMELENPMPCTVSESIINRGGVDMLTDEEEF